LATPAVARVWIAEVPIFFDSFRRHVPAGKAGAAGGDHDIDELVGNPGLHALPDRLDFILDDRAFGDDVAGCANTLDQRRAGFVVGCLARVGHSQHRNLQRHELSAFIDAGHYTSLD
jgi:hypothetical protein